MKRSIYILLGLIIGLVLQLQAANIQSTQSGNFFSTTTWQGGVVPGAGDNVTIKSGHTITMNLVADYTIASITFQFNSDLILTTSNPVYSLIVTGDFKVGNSDIVVDLSANVQAGSITYSGGNSSAININAGYVMSSSGVLSFSSGPHDINVYGTLNIGSAALSGGNNRINIFPGGVVNITNGITLNGSTGLEVNNGGTMNVGGDVNMTGGSSMDISGTVSVDGNFNIASGSVNVEGTLVVDGILDVNWNSITGSGQISAGTIECGAGTGDACVGSIGPSLLPIELIRFEARKIDNRIEISWTTATEEDNDFFTLERSIDAVNFAPITIIDGSGNSYDEIDYKYNDFFFNSVATVYYRLKQTDYNGEYSYSSIIAVNELNTSFSNDLVEISWNTETIDVILVENSTDIEARLYNIKGQVVAQWKMKSMLSGQELNLGIPQNRESLYIVEIVCDGNRMTRKIAF